jgi:hypothetical protein
MKGKKSLPTEDKLHVPNQWVNELEKNTKGEAQAECITGISNKEEMKSQVQVNKIRQSPNHENHGSLRIFRHSFLSPV